ncbi:MAG TPA: hypothetical protein VKT52_12655 [Ktedonobacterales bacterium]|nr:hypothetical protein [Ktedonobacterales bacterium]
MADHDGPEPIPRRRKTDFRPQIELPLRSAILLLGARQLVDIWLSVITVGGNFLLMLVLVFASLSSRYHWPAGLYTVVALIGLLLSFTGLLGSGVLWRWADRRARTFDG